MNKKEIIEMLKRQHIGGSVYDSQDQSHKEFVELREITETKDLEKAFSDLKQDGVEIEVLSSEEIDIYVVIKTKNFLTCVGLNDCGAWLNFHKKIEDTL